MNANAPILVISFIFTCFVSTEVHSYKCDLAEAESKSNKDYKSRIFTLREGAKRKYCEGFVYRENSVTIPQVDIISYRASPYKFDPSRSVVPVSFIGVNNKQVHSVMKVNFDRVQYQRDELIQSFTNPISVKLNIIKGPPLNVRSDVLEKVLLSLASTPYCDKKSASLFSTQTSDSKGQCEKEPVKLVATKIGESKSNNDDLYIDLFLPLGAESITIKLSDLNDPLNYEVDENYKVSFQNDRTKAIPIQSFKGVRLLDVEVKLDNQKTVRTSARLQGY